MAPFHPLASARPRGRRTGLPTTSDAALLAASRTGCAASFGELYRRHEPVLRRIAGSTAPTSHPTEIDDLVADAFARLLAALRNGSGPADNPVPYLVVTIRNRRIAWHRRVIRDRDLVERIGEHLPTDASIPETDADVAAAMLALNPRHRQILWSTEVEGRKPQELAATLGISADAAAALSYRARKALETAYLAQVGAKVTPG